MQTRRTALATFTSAAGTLVLPFPLHADGHGGDVFETPDGPVTIHPIDHASFVMETPMGVIYVDPVGVISAYADLPAPDLILITHEHGDHYNVELLLALMEPGPHLITNVSVAALIPDGMEAEALVNGEATVWAGVGITAIPAYNLTEDRLNFHPKGRDNGYVLDLGGFRVYVSGDTEDIPEMRALGEIDLAFVCMNLPFTMDAAAAADAVRTFRPGAVYPYHYRGRENGTQDPQEFADLVGDASDVRIGGWYP